MPELTAYIKRKRELEEKSGVYTVGEILDERFHDDEHTGEPNLYYKVHWKYFPKSADSWEPQENLQGGEKALKVWAEKKLSGTLGLSEMLAFIGFFVRLIDWLTDWLTVDLLIDWLVTTFFFGLADAKRTTKSVSPVRASAGVRRPIAKVNGNALENNLDAMDEDDEPFFVSKKEVVVDSVPEPAARFLGRSSPFSGRKLTLIMSCSVYSMFQLINFNEDF